MKYLLILAMIVFSTQSYAARYNVIFDENETLCIAQVKKTGGSTYYATVEYTGTWDGATLTFYHSPNNHVPLSSEALIIQDRSYTDVVVTANGMFPAEFGTSRPSSPEYICATMTGAGSSTEVLVKIYDNQ